MKKECFSITARVLFALAMFLCWGCATSPKITELAVAPFEMPDGFPLPDDAEVISKIKPLKGGEGEILFHSDVSYKELVDFYRKKMMSYGLTEDPVFYKFRDDTFNLTFAGWPGGKNLTVNASGRSVSGRVWVRHEPMAVPPVPKFKPVQIKPLFGMPDELPVPDGVKQLSRNNFGNMASVEFYTKMNLDEILAWYRKTFHSYAIKEDPDVTSKRIDSLSARFLGFPGGKWLTMSVEDLAYSSQRDERRVSFVFR